jgi:ABC-type Fe3+ transport system substrate-binding protein
MEIESLISEITSFPVKFLSLGNISFYTFLKDIGYFKDYNQVNEDNVAEALVQNPEYIDAWIGWSEDKR